MIRCSILFILLLINNSVIAAPQTLNKSFAQNSWSIVSLPGIPLNPGPEAMFSTLGGVSLLRWAAPNQSLISYSELDPELFGNLIMTAGYWVIPTMSATDMSYSGLNDNETVDMWISLPKTGWTFIGNPYQHNVVWADVKVTNGKITKSMLEKIDR